MRRLKRSYIIFNNKEFESVFYKFHLRVSIDQRKNILKVPFTLLTQTAVVLMLSTKKDI